MAKKYIDADKLIANLERQNVDKKVIEPVIRIINSLQQEHPCDTCTNDKGCVACKDGELWEGKPVEDLEKEIDKTVNECTDGYNFDWDRFARHFYELGKQSKEPINEDLEKYASRAGFDYVDDIESKYPDHRWNDHDVEFAYRDGIIAGAEWQKAQMPMPEDTVIFQKGIEEGKRLMLEEAVEGYVNYYEDSGGILMAEAQVGCPYHNGDKVKIIIVKEDKE